MTRKYGWIPDSYDHRDLFFSLSVRKVLPKEIDWREFAPAIRNQGQVGACTGFTAAGAHEFLQMKTDPLTVFNPSAYFAYYSARELEGTTGRDAGATIRDVVKGIGKKGICTEQLWPSSNAKTALVKPSDEAVKDGELHQVLQYSRVIQTLDLLKSCIAARYPLCFGVMVYESFQTAKVKKTGVIPIPNKKEKLLGGHALWSCGYSDKNEWFIVANSWGKEFGDKGYVYIPYDYLCNSKLASDFWQLEIVEEEK